MQLLRGQYDSTKLDHELIWLSVSLCSLAFAAGWFLIGLPWPRCFFHDLTGLPCLTCGMTRSTIQFFHGHFLASWRWNPLIFTFLCGLTAFDLYAFAAVVTRAPRLRIHFSESEKKWARFIVIVTLALNWVYLLGHWRQF